MNALLSSWAVRQDSGSGCEVIHICGDMESMCAISVIHAVTMGPISQEH